MRELACATFCLGLVVACSSGASRDVEGGRAGSGAASASSTGSGAGLDGPCGGHDCDCDDGIGGCGFGGVGGGEGGGSSCDRSDPNPVVCVPGETEPCYDGADGTLGTGTCSAGQRTCNAAGTAFGSCIGQSLPAPDDCAAPGSWLCGGQAPACGVLQGGKTFGAPGTLQSALDVASDAAGGVAFAYHAEAADTAGALHIDRFDASGQPVWSRTFDLSGAADPTLWVAGMAFDAQGHLVVLSHLEGSVDLGDGAITNRDILLFTLDAGGQLLWKESYGATAPGSAFPSGLAVHPAGIAVVGSFEGTLDFGATSLVSSGQDGFVLGFDPQALPLWGAAVGGSATDSLAGVATDEAANVYVVGGGDAGSTTGCATSSVLVASFDSTGTLRWKSTFGGGTSDASAHDVAVSGAGDVFVAGRSSNDVALAFGDQTVVGPVFLAKLGTDGVPAWARSRPEELYGMLAPARVGVDASGNVVLATQVDYSPLVTKYDAQGHPLWSRTVIADTPAEFSPLGVTGLDVAPSGGIQLIGNFDGTIDLGSGPIASQGLHDAFIVRLAP